MRRITLAVGLSVLAAPALAQNVSQERHQAEIRRLENEVEKRDAELRDRASVIEEELWSRVMQEDAERTKRDTEAIIERMDASRKRRELEMLQRWQANPYRYEVRSECPPEPESIIGALAAAFKPARRCTQYFVRILVNLQGEDVGTPPERIAGYPPVRKP